MDRRISGLAVMAAVVFAALIAPRAALAAAPDVLSQIHEDAAVAIIIPNLKTLDESLGKFLPAVGMDDAEAKSPVVKMLTQIGANQGVEMNGSAAIVMPQITMGGAPKMVVIVPVESAEKFMANFTEIAEAPNTPGAKQVTMAMGQPGFVKISGKYAVVSDAELNIAQFNPATDATKLYKASGALGQQNFEGHDVLAYVNMAKVGPMFNGLVAMGLTKMQMQLMQDPEGLKQMGGADAVTAMFRMYGTLLSNILLNTDALVLGMRASESGADLTYSIQFKSDTPGAAVFARTSKMTLSMDRLPSKPYFAAIAMDSGAVDWAPVLKAIEEIKGAVEVEGPVSKLLDAYAQNVKAASLYNLAEIAWYAPPAGSPEKLVNLAYVYGANDAAAAMTQLRSATKALADAYAALNTANGTTSTEISYVPSATTLNGAAVDTLKIKLDPKQMMGPMPVDELPTFIVDLAKGFNMHMLQGPGAILAATGEDTALLSEVVKAADGSGKLGQAEAIALARKHLPGSRFMEAYVDLKAIMGFAMEAAKAAGEEVPEEMKIPDMPLIAASMSSAAGGASFTVFIPTATIQAMTQFMMMGRMDVQQGPVQEKEVEQAE